MAEAGAAGVRRQMPLCPASRRSRAKGQTYRDFFLVAFLPFFVAFFAAFFFFAMRHLEKRKEHHAPTGVSTHSSSLTLTRVLTPGSSMVTPYSTSAHRMVFLWCVMMMN